MTPYQLEQRAGTTHLLSSLGSSIKTLVPLCALLVLIDAAVISLLIVAKPVPPETNLQWLTNPGFAVGHIVLHMLAGFLVGAATMNLTKAFIGAGLGPLLDIDHVSVLLGLPVSGRAGHSIIVVLLFILAVWGFSLWRWGAGDFALFVPMEFATHLLVAPPGFPLLSPVSTTLYRFPNWVYLPFVLAFASTYLISSLRTGSSSGGHTSQKAMSPAPTGSSPGTLSSHTTTDSLR